MTASDTRADCLALLAELERQVDYDAMNLDAVPYARPLLALARELLTATDKWVEGSTISLCAKCGHGRFSHSGTRLACPAERIDPAKRPRHRNTNYEPSTKPIGPLYDAATRTLATIHRHLRNAAGK